MTDTINDKRNIKELSITLLEIADCNLLLSTINLENEQVLKQIKDDVNPIGWIFGHCASHMDFICGELCQGYRKLSEKEGACYSFGVSKEEIEEGLPTSFKELIESYLEIRKDAFDYLNKLPEEKFRQVPEADAGKKSKESLMQAIQRVSLHFMGHMGQIVLLRRALGNPGFGFVAGMTKENREKRIDQWMKWWEENKEKFS
ncbi:MAG: DinB family protein [Candidatus Heimdallarchaeota archaeon]|nr:DinB family protein [Candidatus Heimdallarchaeota archaeon]MCG3253502.1 DinB family protein [Candidatus Heimdallarchaeota archaeon]MCK4290639.1 DinB family protein [Candidatus Heimdallarchaeota archaeon]